MNAHRGLEGVRIVVTRPRAQAPELLALLAARGAVPVEVPLIAVADPADGGAALRDALARLDQYDWVVLTSPNGARRVCTELGYPALLGATKVAVIGQATQSVLHSAGIEVTLVPSRQVAEGLLEAFPPAPSARARILLARAAEGRHLFPDGARAKGWVVDDVACYQTLPAEVSDEQILILRGADVVTFTSSSSVRHFAEIVGVNDVSPILACIGPATAATALGLGLAVSVEAADHSIEGLVLALERHLSRR